MCVILCACLHMSAFMWRGSFIWRLIAGENPTTVYHVVVERKVQIEMNCRNTPGLIVCIILLMQLLKQCLAAQEECSLINLNG